MTASPPPGMRLPAAVRIREVGPRDGLQAEAPIPVEARARLIEAILASGLREIEVVSFVSPKAVPSMADPEKVLALLPSPAEVVYVALVPNLRGAERAVSAGIRELSFTVSASPAYNEKNVGMPIEESVRALEQICALDGIGTVDAVISCAFGSPYEGDIGVGEVRALGQRCMAAGASSLTFADTTGMATPRRIEQLVAEVGSVIRLHLHETRGTGLVNAYAALQLGVADFDTSVGGLGGSPFAAGAAGHLATEELVHLLDDLGVATGLDVEKLIAAANLAGELVGHPVPSRIAAAGPRSRRAVG